MMRGPERKAAEDEEEIHSKGALAEHPAEPVMPPITGGMDADMMAHHQHGKDAAYGLDAMQMRADVRNQNGSLSYG